MYVPPLIGAPGPMELGLILVIVLIFFGAGKLPQVFESFGLAVKKFRDAQKEDPLDVGHDQLSDHGNIPEASEVRESASASNSK